MMRSDRISFALLVGMLALCLPEMLRAEDAQQYKLIEPLLGEQAIAVARLDLARISPLAISQVVATQSDLAATIYNTEQASKFAQSLREKAGTTAYLIYSVPTSTQLLALWVAPLGNPDNSSAALKAFPTSSRLEAAWDRKVVDGLLIVGPKQLVAEAVTALHGKAPVASAAGRASLVDVFGAVSEAPSAFAVVPSPDQRRVLSEVTPGLPEPFGGSPLRGLLQSFEWAAVGFDPTKSLRVVLQTPSDEAAADVKLQIEELQEALAKAVERSEAGDSNVRVMLPLVTALRPHAQGRQVIFDLDGEQLTTSLQPVVTVVTSAANRRQAMSQVMQLALAMHRAYEAVGNKEVEQHFPDVASIDAAGKPLLSWRVHLLPFLEQEALYREFHLDEPWDSEHNKKLIERMPDIYRLPGSMAAPGKTCVLLPVGEGTAFPNGKGLAFKEFTDGSSATILAVESDDKHAVNWTAPGDLQVNANEPSNGLGRHYGEGTVVVNADGSANFLPVTISDEQLKARFTPAGREAIER